MGSEKYPDYSLKIRGLRILFPFSKISKRVERAKEWLSNQIIEDTKHYMPIDTGRLQNLTRISDNGKKIIFPGPYARFLYYGKVMVDPVTGSPWARPGAKKVVTDRDLKFKSPTACAFWFQKSKEEHRKEWADGVKNIILGKGGK